jgi:hypothetical protein
LLKLGPYKTTVTNALQPRDPASRVHLCSCFLQSVVGGEINPQLTFFSDEAWFRLQGYINTQNDRYWSSQNPHRWCAVSAKRIVIPTFLMMQLFTIDNVT